MSLDFYQTVGGRQFIEGTMPRIAKALEEINVTLKEIAMQGTGVVRKIKLDAESEQCAEIAQREMERCADLFEKEEKNDHAQLEREIKRQKEATNEE